ncbi:family 43 glycosylhydrolase [Desertivirga arenae]|uniref:family 43 glycosylhydrolase n=1 Tax=Desertivirga arenae TaxID=2810309 RepID=UPI001A96BAEF|nr:family 43 glycosylhydrolase [Pedobacter sp. SYSU D00823]
MKINDKLIELSTPSESPFGFEISIKNNIHRLKESRIFTIRERTNGNGNKIEISDDVESKEHNAFLNFFQRLSADFGTSVPHNRKIKKAVPDFSFDYRTVLTENLDSNMHYGYGDPAIMKVELQGENIYYLVSTSNDAPNAFPIIKSRNLVDWQFCSYIFPEGFKPEWAADGESIADFWAPEMHQVGKEFRVYFVARDKHTKELCLGLARASHPEGPFEAEPEPLIKGNVIDPHLFVEDEKNVYLFWKEDNNDVWPQKLAELLYKNPECIPFLFPAGSDQKTAALIITFWPWAKDLEAMERFFVLQILIEAVIERFTEFEESLKELAQEKTIIEDRIKEILKFMRTPMFIQQLADDGKTLIGEKVKILENDMQWEAHLVEGMWVTKHENHYYLFYAGNDFSTDQYGIGVAISKHLKGPYIKSEKQLIQSTKSWAAPGHPSVLKTEDGGHLMFLHAYFPGCAGYKKFRALLEIQLHLRSDRVLVAQS